MNHTCPHLLIVLWIATAPLIAADNPAAVIQNDVLRVALAPDDASLTITDKRLGLAWQQHVKPGFQISASTIKHSDGSLSAEVTGPGGPYALTIRLTPDQPHGFDVALDLPGRK